MKTGRENAAVLSAAESEGEEVIEAAVSDETAGDDGEGQEGDFGGETADEAALKDAAKVGDGMGDSGEFGGVGGG